VKTVVVGLEFDDWRVAAREVLREGFTPEQVDFQDASVPRTLTLPADDERPDGEAVENPHVPGEFLAAAKVVAANRDVERWNLLYRLLWRLQRERELLRVGVDDDVAELRRLERQVRHDVHKMHAFVRFRKIEEPDGTGGVEEHFIAWHRPEHRILRLAATFFAERFAVMRWTILTPDASVSWEPQERMLRYSEGVGKEAAPSGDELEELWKTYYGSIFNPARLNPRAMRSEMPVKYWEHLPEVTLLPELMQKAEGRVSAMVAKQEKQPTAVPFVPQEHTLTVLRAAMPACEGCELYKCATQVVPGVGASGARLMLVGEQPGDQEDRQGLPFVGPAGAVLRKAMEELGIGESDVYVTNAVKHFKFTLRGKFRLHQNPRMGEINACRPWLLAELDAVQPRVVLCLGASAAKSLLGGTFGLMKSRGVMQESPYARRVMATVHPSAVLRAADEAGRAQLYHFLKGDLQLAHEAALAG
jgi:probable DNA metabolism protein